MDLWSKDGDGNLDALTDPALYYQSYNATTGVWGAETHHTNPHDANAYLRIGQFNVIQNGNGTGVISTISWAPVPGRLYAVQRSFDMQSWLTVADNIEPTPPLNSVTDAGAPPGGRVFYRMVAQRASKKSTPAISSSSASASSSFHRGRMRKRKRKRKRKKHADRDFFDALEVSQEDWAGQWRGALE